MSIDVEIIARIRKILARTEEAGCTAAEAEAAYGKASSLMAKHNLDMAQVEQAAGLDGEGWTHSVVHESGRPSSVLDLVMRLCTTYFFVMAYRNTPVGPDGKPRVGLAFFGSPTNVEAARFIFTSLRAAIDRLWADERRGGSFAGGDRCAFACGVVEGYTVKLSVERRSMIRKRDRAAGHAVTDLALRTIRERTEAAFFAENPNTREIRDRPVSGSFKARTAGFEAGFDLNLSRPLSAPGGPKALARE